MLIVIEGVDGSGKNTVADGVAKHFEALRLDFPYEEDSPSGRLSRLFLQGKWYPHWDDIDFPSDVEYDEIEKFGGRAAIVLQSLMTINKYEQLDLLRRHAGVHNPRHLVLARYTPSALVYGMLDGLDRQWLEAIHAGLPAADVNILVDVSADVALQRIGSRGEQREIYERREQIEWAVGRYRFLWTVPEHRFSYKWWIVDGAKPVGDVVLAAVGWVERLLSDAC